MTMSREDWLKHVAHIEVLIELDGICNALGAFIEALQNIEKDRAEECGEDFFESQEYKNLQHCQKVLDHAMTACDLDVTYGDGEARRVAMDRFEENIKEMEKLNIFKEQA